MKAAARMSALCVVAMVLVAALATGSVAQETRRVIVEPRALGITITTERDRYEIGSELVFYLEATRDCWVRVFNVDVSGRVTQLFPNPYDRDNRIDGRRRVRIPSSSRPDYRFRVTGPPGIETLEVIASDLPAMRERFSGSDFRSLSQQEMESARRRVVVEGTTDHWAHARTEFRVVADFHRSDVQFVRSIYKGLLDRAPTRHEEEIGVRQLQGHLTRADLVNRIIRSDEFFVRQLYLGLLGREPDSRGLDHYVRLLENGEDRTRVIQILLQSEEYRDHHDAGPPIRR